MSIFTVRGAPWQRTDNYRASQIESIYILMTVKSHPNLAPAFQTHTSSCLLHETSSWMFYALLNFKSPKLNPSCMFHPQSSWVPCISNMLQLLIFENGNTIPHTINSVTWARSLGVISGSSFSFTPYIHLTPGGFVSSTTLKAIQCSQDPLSVP